MQKFIIILFIGLTSFLFASVTPVQAAQSFNGGYYTNLCGSGIGGMTDTCNGGCDVNSGTCTNNKPLVVRYSCDGNQSTCRNNASTFQASQNLTGAACGTTVELDVYKKNCQTIFGWFCNDTDRVDYMTWYAGDCNGQSSSTTTIPVTPTPAQSTSSCSSLSITKGNNGGVPATVTLQAAGTDSAGPISDYLFYFGDGEQQETPNSQVQHQYQISGTFTSRVFIKDAGGNWKTSPTCQQIISVSGNSLETQKSACSNLFILSGNYTQAPSTVTFQVTGYDNKGGVKSHRADLGNGRVMDSQSDTITAYYPTAGTFIIHGYILDSQNLWTGANATCTRTLYVTTKPLTSQPGTGTPTLYTIIALVSGTIGVSLILSSGVSLRTTSGKRRRARGRRA